MNREYLQFGRDLKGDSVKLNVESIVRSTHLGRLPTPGGLCHVVRLRYRFRSDVFKAPLDLLRFRLRSISVRGEDEVFRWLALLLVEVSGRILRKFASTQ